MCRTEHWDFLILSCAYTHTFSRERLCQWDHQS
jgi:hypothetical protein